jgi:hypothetical protein
MLIERSKIQVGEIINLKLVSGDEIVGELVDHSNNLYELRKPCIVVTSSDGIGLIQAMFGLDPDVENLSYKENHIITACHTHERMRDHYITITTAQPE